ncbi:MAG: ABC transporter substrate-binding protein, partial [Eggerthellaceae bacterium]|nr:ABC transporter substrate-binding protein [Eggerthellaceae bacterium]
MSYQNGISRRQFVGASSAAAAAALVAGLAGCSSESGSAASASASAASASASASSAAAAATQTITDLGGDTVVVPTKIDKIADLWHAHNQVILMLGAGDKLVGTTENFKKRPWANVVYPKLSEVTALVVGTGAGEVNYEEALSLEPDVVFASNKDVVATARQQGLTAVNVMFQDYEGLRNDVNLTAKILGSDAEDLAKEWETYLNANIDLVAQRMKDVADADKPKVLHIVSPSSFTKVDGLNNIVDEWIKLAGGVNALTAEGNMIDLTVEDLVASDPDIIIIGSGAAESVKQLMEDEAWSGVTAVKNGAVYANPSGVFAWDRYSGEEALQVLWAAKKLNPDKFEDVNIEKETKDFYMQFYGYQLTDEQVSQILN